MFGRFLPCIIVYMKKSFPDNFLWGSAISSHQVEGDNFHNDWWAWEKAGHTEPSGKACDHYRTYEKDFSLAKELNHNALRLSLEWSRLQNEDGSWRNSEWEHYKKVLDSLILKGIKPILTLNHFTLPNWLAKKGGWLNNGSPDLFIGLAEKSALEFGEKTQLWVTINEPNILAMLAYQKGEWPPCRKNHSEALTVLSNMLKGHCGAYQAIKSLCGNETRIGIAKAVTAFHPCRRNNLHDILAAKKCNFFHNHSFILSSILGKNKIPGLRPNDLCEKKCMDFIGINYYFRHFIRGKKLFGKNSFGQICSNSHHPESGPLTDMGWEVYPRGIYEVMRDLFRYKLPFLVTENGIATENHDMRTDFIKKHLFYVEKAISEGLPVMGYLHWSLLDNFEWAEGFSKKFGLIHVDFKTQKRDIKPSARYYSEIIKKAST